MRPKSAICCGVLALSMTTLKGGELTVMTYNIWVGLNETNELQRQVDLITAAGADIVGLQERGSTGAQAIAEALGFEYQVLGGSTAVLSRFPIVGAFGDGVEIDLGSGNSAFMFDVHLAPYPYQPYDFRDGLITTELEAISGAIATRGAAIGNVLNQMTTAIGSGMPTFLVGDFNEPSHLDWTQEAADEGLHFTKVAWPTSTSVVNAGMTDAYRDVHPDPVARPGDTWTPRPEPNEVHDRIDRVYFAGHDVTVTGAILIGEPGGPDVDLASNGVFPSDHRAVAATFTVPFDILRVDRNPMGDLNQDGVVDALDWAILSLYQHSDLSALSLNEAYLAGDLNADKRNDHLDFRLFKEVFDAARGQGAFDAMLATIPEPSSLAALLAGAAIGGRRRRRAS